MYDTCTCTFQVKKLKRVCPSLLSQIILALSYIIHIHYIVHVHILTFICRRATWGWGELMALFSNCNNTSNRPFNTKGEISTLAEIRNTTTHTRLYPYRSLLICLPKTSLDQGPDNLHAKLQWYLKVPKAQTAISNSQCDYAVMSSKEKGNINRQAHAISTNF